ncbi:hypothetical protein SFUMM280S_09737 [Streptomyces fumanus]
MLRADGVYLANLADGAPFAFLRSQLATFAAHFAELVLIAEPVCCAAALRHAAPVAAHRPLDAGALARRTAAAPSPPRNTAPRCGPSPATRGRCGTRTRCRHPEPPEGAFSHPVTPAGLTPPGAPRHRVGGGAARGRPDAQHPRRGHHDPHRAPPQGAAGRLPAPPGRPARSPGTRATSRTSRTPTRDSFSPGTSWCRAVIQEHPEHLHRRAGHEHLRAPSTPGGSGSARRPRHGPATGPRCRRAPRRARSRPAWPVTTPAPPTRPAPNRGRARPQGPPPPGPGSYSRVTWRA